VRTDAHLYTCVQMTAPTSAPRHSKVSRAEWIEAALATLRSEGIDQVRVLTLAQRLEVKRSSFYWYFQSRQDLLNELIGAWSARNTSSIVERASRPAATITAAVLGIFECWTDDRFFDPKLDFAVRAWASRDVSIEAVVVSADQTRLDAIDAMYARHGFDDSMVRARVLYYTQVGYYALGIDEPINVRLGLAPSYLRALTGQDATTSELADFATFLGGAT
jgi:AcrR family transcriptional regulator